jgi:glyoxylase-like metal-dependent hydrolase (beta-lactamase superfamily II)
VTSSSFFQRCQAHRVVAFVVVLAGARLLAQTHPSTTVAGLETIQIRPNVYVIFGAGANITVHTGEDGVILVDTGSGDKADSVLQAVRAITKDPIRVIINTSADPDHVGGNEKIAAAGQALNPDSFGDEDHATVLGHEKVLLRMSAPESTFPTGAWPTETYTSRLRSMYVNDEAVQIIRQVGAHSDADSMVLFRKADVLVTGDVVDLRQFPIIDPKGGGSIQGELDALNRILDYAVPNMPMVTKAGRTLVVPGHGYVSDYGEVVEYRDMVTVIKDIIEDMIKKRMTLQQVKAANPTKGYRGRYGKDTGPWTTDMFVEAIYNGLKK